MLTNPSTLGLFDENIEEIRDIFHGAGALMYYDGANLNAVCGISRPGDMGFDIVHINLHKTFSQPHGGGGPGGGPIAVRASARPFLPVPVVVRDGDRFRLDYDRPKSIGKVRGFSGPFGVFVRSYAFMRAWGPGLREMSEIAVLNANYLLARLKDAYDLPFDRLCMHEFVLSARTLKREHGITRARRREAADGLRLPPADRLLPARRPRGADDRADRDRGEGDARRVRRRDARRSPARRRRSPSSCSEAPHDRPVRRLDEVRAAKQPVVRYAFERALPSRTGANAVLETQKGADAERPVPRAAGGALRGDADVRADDHLPRRGGRGDRLVRAADLGRARTPQAKAIMENAQQEEFKHFAMALEFLLRRKPKWRVACKDVLFHKGDIVELGEKAEDGRGRRRSSSLARLLSARSSTSACPRRWPRRPEGEELETVVACCRTPATVCGETLSASSASARRSRRRPCAAAAGEHDVRLFLVGVPVPEALADSSGASFW